MKSLLTLLLLITLNVSALDQAEIKVIRVYDSNRELIAGAKVELKGSGRVFYTNLRGECYIPVGLYRSSGIIKVESISYKSVQMEVSEINAEIILQSR